MSSGPIRANLPHPIELQALSNNDQTQEARQEFEAELQSMSHQMGLSLEATKILYQDIQETLPMFESDHQAQALGSLLALHSKNCSIPFKVTQFNQLVEMVKPAHVDELHMESETDGSLRFAVGTLQGKALNTSTSMTKEKVDEQFNKIALQWPEYIDYFVNDQLENVKPLLVTLNDASASGVERLNAFFELQNYLSDPALQYDCSITTPYRGSNKFEVKIGSFTQSIHDPHMDVLNQELLNQFSSLDKVKLEHAFEQELGQQVLTTTEQIRTNTSLPSEPVSVSNMESWITDNTYTLTQQRLLKFVTSQHFQASVNQKLAYGLPKNTDHSSKHFQKVGNGNVLMTFKQSVSTSEDIAKKEGGLTHFDALLHVLVCQNGSLACLGRVNQTGYHNPMGTDEEAENLGYVNIASPMSDDEVFTIIDPDLD